MASTVKTYLGQWHKLFPDGISRTQYNRIGKIIALWGRVKAELIPGDTEQLDRELDRIEKTYRNNWISINVTV